MKCCLGISNFLEEISSLSYSVIFLYFFSLISEEGFLISPCYSLVLCIQMLISFLFCFAFASLLFTGICKPSPESHFAFLHCFSMGMVLVPVSCTMSRSSTHSSSGTLSDLIPWMYFSLPLYNHRDLIWSYLKGLVIFSTFFNLSLNLARRSSWSEPQSAPGVVFADCIELLHLWLQRI